MRRNGAYAALLAWGIASAASTVSPAQAQSARALQIDTTGQSLATALTDIARRSGRELLLAAPTIGGRDAPRLKGRYTLDQALPLLLVGSGLGHRRSADGVYIIEVAPRLPPPAPEVPVALPELLVTARTQNSDIQRTENDIQPYKVWTSRGIEQTGSTDINDFLRVTTTANAQIASALQTPADTNASNRSEVDLRGLGSNQTLVLVDGRRMPALPSGASASILQSDLNGLPLAAVERIEVLNSTAGGVYGSGATAGAINVVLKRDYQGADLSGAYGITDGGDAATRRLDGRVGFSPDDGRTEVMVAFGLLRADALSAGSRDYSARARAKRLANDPASALADYPVSRSINIFSASGAALVLDPAYGGASLGAATTFAPASYGGATSDGGALLLANAGRLDFSLSPDVSGERQTLLSKRETSSLIGSVRRRFGEAIEAYADLLVLQNDGEAVIPWNTSQAVRIVAGAPTNPFQQDIYVTFPAPGFDPVVRSRSRTTRGTVGVIAELSRGWKLSADYSAGSARIDVALTARPPGPIVSTAVMQGRGLDGGAPLSPLGGLDALLGALASHTVDAGYAFSQVDRFQDRSIRLAGPILDLGGGPLTLSLTAEDRRDHVPSSVYRRWDPLSGLATETPMTSLTQSARHYYAELRAPLTDRRDGPIGLKGLEFQLALSRERNRERLAANLASEDPRYATTKEAAQTTTVYTAGFKFLPFTGLMVRASAASGFLPPRTDQLWSTTGSYTSDPDTFANSSRYLYLPASFAPKDPRRGGEALGLAGGYDIVEGGSTNLLPERARSLSAGVVLTPTWLERLRVSIDYTRIDKRREIVSASAHDVDYFLDNEALFPGRVTRAPLSDADRAKGFTAGVVTAVDTTALNIGRTLVEAIDLQGDYLIPTTRLGDFKLRAAATWQPHLRRRADPRSEAVEAAGYADGPLVWRANGGLDWAKGATTLGVNIAFYDGYRVFDSTDSADTVARKVLQQGASRVPPQAYVDLYATRRVALETTVGGLREVQLRFGVQNVLDHDPPLIAQSSPSDRSLPYSPYGDPRGRRFEFGLVGHF